MFLLTLPIRNMRKHTSAAYNKALFFYTQITTLNQGNPSCYWTPLSPCFDVYPLAFPAHDTCDGPSALSQSPRPFPHAKSSLKVTPRYALHAPHQPLFDKQLRGCDACTRYLKHAQICNMKKAYQRGVPQGSLPLLRYWTNFISLF